MDSPFSMQMVSLSCRTALVLPQKLRNFRSQSSVTETPDDVIMDVGFVDVGADHKGVFVPGKPLGKFSPQPVGFFRSDLAWNEGLPHMISDHIILAAHSGR